MDKETLSNYGWVVIAVLVLSVMIALATPFGTYIGNAVKSTTEGLFDVQQKAMGVAGLVVEEQNFPQPPDPALNPDNGTTPVDGDTYEYGDYKYTYKSSSNGWGVKVIDKTKVTYGPILESINGMPVTDMTDAFYKCASLTTAPAIPNSVTNMSYAFQGCTSLTSAPAIPSNVTNMIQTFKDCSALTTAPDMSNATSVTTMYMTFYGCSFAIAPTIPSNVVNMSYTFQLCKNLTTAPVIPSSVTNMYCTFANCSSLVNAPAIPTGVTNMNSTFSSCTALTSAPAIPSSVTDMLQTFYGCTMLTGTVSVPCTATTNSYTVPSGVTLETYHYDGCGH